MERSLLEECEALHVIRHTVTPDVVIQRPHEGGADGCRHPSITEIRSGPFVHVVGKRNRGDGTCLEKMQPVFRISEFYILGCSVEHLHLSPDSSDFCELLFIEAWPLPVLGIHLEFAGTCLRTGDLRPFFPDSRS